MQVLAHLPDLRVSGEALRYFLQPELGSRHAALAAFCQDTTSPRLAPRGSQVITKLKESCVRGGYKQ